MIDTEREFLDLKFLPWPSLLLFSLHFTLEHSDGLQSHYQIHPANQSQTNILKVNSYSYSLLKNSESSIYS